MKHLNGIDIRQAAPALNKSHHQLLRELADMGAIRKTSFGWTADQTYHQRGLLKTDTRQHQYRTEMGAPIKRIYTVVLITGDGLSWLQDKFNTGTKQ